LKIVPIINAITEAYKKGNTIHYRLVHTGQHYDQKMSTNFFRELNITEPDLNLGCSGGSQTEQTAAIMVAFEKDILANPCDLMQQLSLLASYLAYRSRFQKPALWREQCLESGKYFVIIVHKHANLDDVDKF
jgi:UDP-N-acetylglucosamine 2-epimerase (non-hydrolysing)